MINMGTPDNGNPCSTIVHVAKKHRRYKMIKFKRSGERGLFPMELRKVW